MGLKETFKVLTVTLIASMLLIIMAMIYFGITLWVINTASMAFLGASPEANWAVLSAALMSVGAVLAGALEKKSMGK